MGDSGSRVRDLMDEELDAPPAPKPGHNSGIDPAFLKATIKEIEACDTEIENMKDDRKGFLEAAKEKGYSPKIINKLVALRKRPKEDVKAEQDLLEQYAFASGTECFD